MAFRLICFRQGQTYESTISGNTKGIDAAAGQNVTATQCYWGAANGSASAGGSGDTFTGPVDASSPLGTSAVCAPLP